MASKTADQLEGEARAAEARVRLQKARIQSTLLRRQQKLISSYKTTERTRRRDWPRSRGGRHDSHLDQITLDALRRDSQDLVRNSELASTLMARLVDMVIGREGFRLNMTTGDRDYNRRVEEAWKRRAESTDGDAAGLLTHLEMQAAIVRTWPEDGDLLYLKTAGGRAQFIEGERLVNPQGIAPNSEHFVNGVEIDPDSGRPLAYHVAPYRFDGRSVDLARTQRLTAVTAGGFCDLLRNPHLPAINRHRGEPALARAARRIERLEELDVAIVDAFQMAACSGMWHKTALPAEDGGPTGETIDRNGESETLVDYQPGMYWRIGLDDEMGMIKSEHPSTQYEAYMIHQLSRVSADLGVPIVLALYTFEQVNFHGARSMVQMAMRGMGRTLSALRDRFLSPDFRHFLGFQLRTGAIAPPASMTDEELRSGAALRHEWTPPAGIVLDPKSENEGDALAQERGLETDQDIVRRRTGRSIEEHYELLAREQEMRNRFGLVRVVTPGAGSAEKPPAEKEDESREPKREPKRDPGGKPAE